LCIDRVLNDAQKLLDSKVLFYPLEKQLGLPVALVENVNGQWRQGRDVGQEVQSLLGFGIFQLDTPQMIPLVLSTLAE